MTSNTVALWEKGLANDTNARRSSIQFSYLFPIILGGPHDYQQNTQAAQGMGDHALHCCYINEGLIIISC